MSAELRECGICTDYSAQGVEVHEICLTRLLDERDAAIRRAEELEAALRDVYSAITIWQGKDPAAEIYFAVELTKARAALRSQESQKPDPLAAKDSSAFQQSGDPSDCPRCGEWRDNPTTDCANCGHPGPDTRSQESQKPPEAENR